MCRLLLLLAVFALAGCQQPLEARLTAGEAAARGGKWEEARARWEEATQLAPRSALAWTRLGTAQWELGRFDEAARAWVEALAVEPASLDAREGLARLALRSADAGAAVALLEDAGVSPSAQLALAQALLSRGGPADDAAALALVPPTAGAEPIQGYLRGCAQIALRRFADAQATLEALQREHPASPLGSYGLARLAAAQQRQTDALLHLSAARTAAGSDWNPQRVAADPAFAFISKTPEFQRLLSK